LLTPYLSRLRDSRGTPGAISARMRSRFEPTPAGVEMVRGDELERQEQHLAPPAPATRRESEAQLVGPAEPTAPGARSRPERPRGERAPTPDPHREDGLEQPRSAPRSPRDDAPQQALQVSGVTQPTRPAGEAPRLTDAAQAPRRKEAPARRQPEREVAPTHAVSLPTEAATDKPSTPALPAATPRAQRVPSTQAIRSQSPPPPEPVSPGEVRETTHPVWPPRRDTPPPMWPATPRQPVDASLGTSTRRRLPFAEAARREPPRVSVTIDRIDVRADPPRPAPSPSPSPAAARRTTSLADYLRSRAGRQIG
jgi:hypothetical protein